MTTNLNHLDAPVVASLIEDLLKREEVGIQHYGAPLTPKTRVDMRREAWYEALDWIIYQKAALERDLEIERLLVNVFASFERKDWAGVEVALQLLYDQWKEWRT